MVSDAGQHRDDNERSGAQRRDAQAERSTDREAPALPASPANYASALPGIMPADPRLNGRGNGPVRAALLQTMQQTYGNRSMQRYLQRSVASRGLSVQRCGAEVHEGCACAAGLQEQAPAGAPVQREPAGATQTAPPQIGSPTTAQAPAGAPTGEQTGQDAVGYLQRMAEFVRTLSDSARVAMLAAPGQQVTAAQREQAHRTLNQERIARFLQQAKSTHDAQLAGLPANDPLRVQIHQAYVRALGELHRAADVAVSISDGMPSIRDAERQAYTANVALCVESGPVTSTLGGTPAQQSSALPQDVLTAHSQAVTQGNMQMAYRVIVDAMRARGEIDDRLMATQAVTGREADCQQTNAYIVDDAANGANTISCSCVGPEGNKVPNPRIRVLSGMIRDAEKLHHTLLHEYRHVLQDFEDCNRPAGAPSSSGGICTDCNQPVEMDAYLAQLESGYAPTEIRSAWVRIYTNWSYLAPEQQQVFRARRDAAQQKIDRLFPGVNWGADPEVIRYNNWCSSLDTRVGGNSRGSCDAPIAPLNRPVPAAGGRAR